MRKWITWITLGISILSAGYDWLRPDGDAETAAELALVATMLSPGGSGPGQAGH